MVLLNPSEEDFINWTTATKWRKAEQGLDGFFEKLIVESMVEKTTWSYDYFFSCNLTLAESMLEAAEDIHRRTNYK